MRHQHGCGRVGDVIDVEVAVSRLGRVADVVDLEPTWTTRPTDFVGMHQHRTGVSCRLLGRRWCDCRPVTG
jgi:hypothetical protein